jgi:3-oxoacyl-[acyl-carrier-protein] synthase III
MTIKRAVIIGSGHALPARRVTNSMLVEQGVETSDEWIQQRTGIRQRYVAGEGETTLSLALAAAREALRNAGAAASTIDAIILATTTPDHTFPATAVELQAALGIEHGFAFDVQAVCSGFVYALTLADNFIRLGQARRVLVVGAECFTRLLDWQDRATCVLFGDGAGAVLLEAVAGTGQLADRGVLATKLHSDGRHWGSLHTKGGAGTTGTVGKVHMAGQEVFRHAVRCLSDVVDEILLETGVAASAIDWLVPHQANQRIIDSTAKKLQLPSEKIILTVGEHANTSAASIPLALSTAIADGRIQSGQLILLDAMGAGFTWGAALVRM